MNSKVVKSIVLILSLIVVGYTVTYLFGYDPGAAMYDQYGQIKRGLSRLAVFYAISLVPILIKPKLLWGIWVKNLLWLLPPFAIVYYIMAAPGDFWFGPIGAAEILGPLFVLISWIALGIRYYRHKNI